MNAEKLGETMEAAQAAAAVGRWDEAERLWNEALRLDPRNANVLFSLGAHAMHRRDYATAVELMAEAARSAPGDPRIPLSEAIAHRLLGDGAAEMHAIQRALSLDPYFLPALLAKGVALERLGAAAAAAVAYANALKVAPHEGRWPAELRPQLEHARRQSQSHAAALEAHLLEAVSAPMKELNREQAGRWREAVAIRAGCARPYHSEGSQLHIPRLAPIPFYDPDLFPWARAFETGWEDIAAEFAMLGEGGEGFAPYIALRDGDPVDQWRDLNGSNRWSTFHLYRHGQRIEANAARCPRTMSALAGAELSEIDTFCPNVMFSALAAGTHIPPHQGETNVRLVAHLPLIVPNGCTYRVGYEQRQWTPGKLLIFDDTIEHEARNDSAETRVVLIFDVWHPALSPAERAIARTLAVSANTFNAVSP